MSTSISIAFGALAEPIGTQVRRQGFMMPEDDLSRAQRTADALMALRFSDVLTDGEARKVQHRIVKQITRAISGKT